MMELSNIKGVPKNKRMQNLDIARTFAILCIILCHSVEIAYSDIILMDPNEIAWIFRIVFFTIGRLGVPIFLFLTGALTLKKQIEKDEDVFKFYKHNLIPLLLTVEIWNVIYNIFLKYIEAEKFDFWNMVIQNVLFLKQNLMPNMWYMPMIIGIYIAIPFIAKIVKTFSIKNMKIPMILVFITSILLPSINLISGITKLEEYNTILNLQFLGRRIWIIYFIRLLYKGL